MPLLSQSQINEGLSSKLSVGNHPFQSTLRLNDVMFTVSSPNTLNHNTIKITPTGMKTHIDPIELPIDGLITGAEVADLNHDGYPEVYVYLNTANPKAYGSVLAYASNRNLSLTPICMPPIIENAAMAKGYDGRDEFAIVESRLMRRFPTSKINGEQRYRQIAYRLIAGEAGWILKPGRIDDF